MDQQKYICWTDEINMLNFTDGIDIWSCRTSTLAVDEVEIFNELSSGEFRPLLWLEGRPWTLEGFFSLNIEDKQVPGIYVSMK